jgi:hypothetical protein
MFSHPVPVRSVHRGLFAVGRSWRSRFSCGCFVGAVSTSCVNLLCPLVILRVSEENGSGSEG